ncbi:hypothetical protein SK128_003997 [Halocaridina rubra]|uniref:Uncharacterized protein n=1 Tax=Halocaridina rubra TaxID=373956 RepID=A0AAN9A7M6_HALRR
MLNKPTIWWGLDYHSRMTTFSRLQNILTFTTAILAAHQMDSVQDFMANTLATRVMHRPINYYKSILLSYRHPKVNGTFLSLPHNFYETYQRDDKNATVVMVAYKNLHCTLNTLPW